MLKKIHIGINILYEQLGRTWFFTTSLVVFFLHATWLALSSSLLPYDEYFHIGIIKYYANQWSPFITHQPFEVSYYGDLTRLPSYMYHYLMSFPYRFINLFTENEMVITILLRFLNIGLIIGGILVFKKLLLRAGFSRRLIHVVVAFFVLTPFVVMLGAENNYDNLMFLMTPICMWFAYSIVKKSRVEIFDVIIFLSTGLFTCLVKHSFIVIFGALGVFILFQFFKKRKGLVQEVQHSYRTANKTLLVAASLLPLCLTGLFIERHVINVVRHHEISVSCSKVQPEHVCRNFSPWNRNQKLKSSPLPYELYGNPLSFTQHWGATIMAGLYPVFANIPHEVSSRPDPFGDYVFKPRLALLLAIAYVTTTAGLVALALQWKLLQKNMFIKMLLFVSFTLIGTLFLFNYRTYLTLGKAYAVQVRYFLPVMLPFAVILAYCLSKVVKNPAVKKVAVLGTLLIYLWCGGVAGWIIRAEKNWYWQNRTVINVNQRVQQVLQKIVPN